MSYDPNYESEYAKAVADGVLVNGLLDPLNSRLQDYVVHRRREQAEKQLPFAPNTDQRGYVEASVENCVKSRVLDDESARPQTLAELDAELKAKKLAEDEARIRQIVYGKLY